MQAYFSKFFNAAVEWIFRPRSIGLALVRNGVALFALIFAFGFIFNLSWPISNGHIDLKIDTSIGTPQLIAYVVAALASGLIRLGGGLEFRRFQRLQRKRVIAIEMRGLSRRQRQKPSAPLTRNRGRIAAPIPLPSASAPAWPNLASRCERMMSGIATGQRIATSTGEGQDDERQSG